MKIRSRLLLIYGIIITLLLLVGFFSLTSILNLGKEADELSELYSQSIRAEQLRWNTQRQINYSLDFILGDIDARDDFEKVLEVAASLAVQCEQNGYAIGFLTNGKVRGGQAFLPVSRGRQQLLAILEILARLDMKSQGPFRALQASCPPPQPLLV